MASPTTGLVFLVVGGWLRVLDPATGLLPLPDEERAARIAAEFGWQTADRARLAAERNAQREE